MVGPDAMSDNELLREARNGDADAFARLFEQYRPLLYRIAYRLVGANDCDDVVMDTYLKVWRALPSYKGKASLKNWLCRVVRNAALDTLRSRSRRNEREVPAEKQHDDEHRTLEEIIPDTRAPAPDAQAHASDLHHIIYKAIEELPEHHRIPLLLREVDGCSYKEIAAATGVSVGTVMSRLFYAKRTLRKLLKDIEP
mgnify:FL=1